MFDLSKLIVDLFCGGGGASEGIKQATDREPDIAIDYEPLAIATHSANHHDTKHYCADVMDIDPIDVCCGREVGILWLSPPCTDFSRAKGNVMVSAKIRALANAAIIWAESVRPDIIFMENVPEFCFPPETAVLSKRGMVPIGELVVGDEVWTHNARWKPVTRISRRKANTISVTGYGNSIVETTENHQFYARQYAPRITQSGKAGRGRSRHRAIRNHRPQRRTPSPFLRPLLHREMIHGY